MLIKITVLKDILGHHNNSNNLVNLRRDHFLQFFIMARTEDSNFLRHDHLKVR